MKKIININFHGRVIPIEETAYDILKNYVESLRKHFANEEGRDEIVNDIENRFAELFSERLIKGSTCITDEDVNSIISSMGRPEDFEDEDLKANNDHNTDGTKAGTSQTGSQSFADAGSSKRLYRSANDKVLGGVCAGLATYLKVDPVIVRIIFAFITLAGFGSGILLYFILWAVLPARSFTDNVRKRLYRNPDNRVIGGVAGGLAAYFHIEVWIWRLIFALPLLLGVVGSVFRNLFDDFDPSPAFITGGFGGTLFLTYIILWIALPEATTASEKLEMRGEKVDLASIKNTIKSDLEGFKGKAAQVGSEIRERAQYYGSEIGKATQNFGSEAGPIIRTTGSGFAHAIGVLFKSFFLLIAGVITFALISALIAIIFSGSGLLPLRNYLFSGVWQNFLAWASLILFFGTPLIALLTWLVRRLIRVRSGNNHYLGYVFGSLWVVGLICLIGFMASFFSSFRSRASVEEDITISQPTSPIMIVKAEQGKIGYYGSDWAFGMDWDDAPFFGVTEDSMMMSTVKLNISKSSDADYHLHKVKFSHSFDPTTARDLANQIRFESVQHDSVLTLPAGFSITSKQKFRNQQVLIVLEVPVGKKVKVDRSIDDYHWFNINIHRVRRGWNMDWDDNWNNSYDWNSDVEYVMTRDGLKRTDDGDDDEEDNNSDNNSNNSKKTPEDNNGYRYKAPGTVPKSAVPATPAPSRSNTDSIKTKAALLLREMKQTRNAEIRLLCQAKKVSEPLSATSSIYLETILSD